MQPDSREFIATRSHSETHLTSSAMLQDIVIGLSDGLTVPFALAAGLSGAVASSSLVIIPTRPYQPAAGLSAP